MDITKKMYELAQQVVKEYEKIQKNKCNTSQPLVLYFEDEQGNLFNKDGNIQDMDLIKCYDNCIKYFPVDLIPHQHFQRKKWLDCIDKLHRLDNLQYSDIELIVKKTREDEFWSKNFLTLLKLRRKDRNGIPYWKVFREKFKNKKSNIEETYNAYEQAKRELGL